MARTCRVFREGRGEDVGADEAERALRDHTGTVWIDIEDPGEDDRRFLEASFGLHGLLLEDIEHRDQRPRVETFDGFRFLSLRPLSLHASGDQLEVTEVHAIFTRDVLVTLRYAPSFDLATVLDRIASRPDLASVGAGGMAYVLLDAVVDDLLDIVDRLEEEVEDLEELVFAYRPGSEQDELDMKRRRFHGMRVNLGIFRRQVAPLRRVVEALAEDRELVGPELVPYYRDLADHVLRALEFEDDVRDVLTSLIEVRMTQQANDLNEVMKKLTAWAGIILVPTLIAGIYGMNFRHMPELDWTFGYPLALLVMGGSALALWFTFRRRGWL